MEIQEYQLLMKSVSAFAGKIGLNPHGLYKETYNPSTNEPSWVISVSWKDKLDGSDVLYTSDKKLEPKVRFKLEFPVITGIESEIKRYAKKAEDVGAEYFLKQSISSDEFVEPLPSFLGLSKVIQVEYALHEAFHVTSKYFMGREVQQIPVPMREEARAMIAGHIGAIAYFKGSDLEDEALSHWQKHLDFANKVIQFYKRLQEIYTSKAENEGRYASQEQKLKEREEVFSTAREQFGNELGLPINNAFFRYWNYFYGVVPIEYKRVSGLENIYEAVKRLKGN